ncbi:MAG: response regulator [Desulfobacteraceae bacterium IS3]|jgi:two-component system chemotaxis response regulator CheY|nr:MAG: response regulator [Desulfobacteraceae bacterium IS3]HAO21047.1 response regulator [Desulfobacteraceae bacterium]
MMASEMCVLIVDDFSIMRGIIRRMLLKEFGTNNIFEAEDGITAWQILSSEKIDLVLCDWNMPNMTGLDLLEKVRSHKDFSKVPFIMITAEGKKENVIEATKKGVSGYIIKPFTAKDLRKKLSPIFQTGE